MWLDLCFQPRFTSNAAITQPYFSTLVQKARQRGKTAVGMGLLCTLVMRDTWRTTKFKLRVAV